MTGWRDAMNADIVAFFDDIDYRSVEVVDIKVDKEDRGPGCRSCSWTQFVVEVTFDTESGRVTRSYEGNIAEFLTAVWEAGEKRREEEGGEANEDAYPGDYGWAHRRLY